MKQGITVLFAVMVGGTALAEPSPTISWLMNEPASMFDIGILRLRDQNEQWKAELVEKMAEVGGFDALALNESSAGVVYVFEENRITIEVSFAGEPDEQACESLLGHYRSIIWGGDDRLSPEMATRFFANAFGHVNYSVGGAPPDWQERVAEIVRVTVGIQEEVTPSADDSPELAALRQLAGGRTIFCTSPLTRDSVSFQKYGF